ncbi:hypothetical protein D3C87_965610 [compost metagenome]
MKRLVIAALSLLLAQQPLFAGEVIILNENEKAQVFAVPEREVHGSWFLGVIPGLGQAVNNEWMKALLVAGGTIGFLAAGQALDPYAELRASTKSTSTGIIPDRPVESGLALSAGAAVWLYGIIDAAIKDASKMQQALDKRNEAINNIPETDFKNSVQMGKNRYALRLSKAHSSISGANRKDVSGNIVDPDAMNFEDNSLNLEFGFLETGIQFTLKNKLNRSVKILWDQASYIDEFGKAKRVAHEGVRFIERDRSMPPAIVPAMSSISDHVFPSDNAYFGASKWEIHSLLYPGETEKLATYPVGKEITLLLPIQAGSETIEYNFSFRIYGVRAEYI